MRKPQKKRRMQKPQKKVIIELRTKLIAEVPEDWDNEMIEFYYGDSSFCLGNLVEMVAADNEQDPHHCNICHRAKVDLICSNPTEQDLSEISETASVHKAQDLCPRCKE